MYMYSASFFFDLCCVLHFVLLFCVLTGVKHWAVLQIWCNSVLCTVKKISPFEMKFFIYVIIGMTYVLIYFVW